MQTSVTAGTVMHGSKLPLTVWFWAAYLMTTHSNGSLVSVRGGGGIVGERRAEATVGESGAGSGGGPHWRQA